MRFSPDAAFVARTRHELGLSQADLGKLLGVHQTTVMRWERGQRPIRRVFMDAIRRLREQQLDDRRAA